jgi:uncharacterized protein (DUF4415 family)
LDGGISFHRDCFQRRDLRRVGLTANDTRAGFGHRGKPMKKGASKRLTREQLAELKSLAALPDSAIDTSDAPELLDWSGAKRGLFYRPVKQQLTLRLDADVVAWFKRHTRSNEGYQTRINRALREYVQGQASRSRRSRA